jgi:tetratricopeptide (TPR) repeat protein
LKELIREGNLLSAESAFNDSLHRDNTNNIYLTNLAKTLLKKHGNNKNKSNVLSNVEGYLKKSLEIRPSDIEALELMIAVQIYLKNHEEAIKYFEKLFVNSVNEISARKTSKITECILISHLMNLVYIKNINNNELKHVHDLLYKGELTISHKESYLCIYNALHSYSSEINDNKSLLERIPYQFLLFSIGYLLFDPSTWFSSFGNSKPKGSFIFS